MSLKAYTKLAFGGEQFRFGNYEQKEDESLWDFVDRVDEVPNRPRLYIGNVCDHGFICYVQLLFRKGE